MTTTDQRESKIKPPVPEEPPEVTDIVVVSNPPAHNEGDEDDDDQGDRLRAYGKLACTMKLAVKNPSDYMVMVRDFKLSTSKSHAKPIPGSEGTYCCEYQGKDNSGKENGSGHYKYLSTGVKFKARLSTNDTYTGVLYVYRKYSNGDLILLFKYPLEGKLPIENIRVSKKQNP